MPWFFLACQVPEQPPVEVEADSAADDTDEFEGDRLVFQGFLELAGAMDVAGERDVVVLAGGNHPTVDVLIADVSDPTQPTALATLEDIGDTRDVHLEDGILYTSHESEPVGARIWDLSDPTEPTLLGVTGAGEQIHNLHVGGGHLYLADISAQAVRIYDVADPAEPLYVGHWAPSGGGVHDQTWVDDRLYVAGTFGFTVLDVSDPADPQTLHEWSADSFEDGVHNIWPTADGRHVLTTHEVLGGSVRVFDLEAGPAELTRWPESEPNCAHNVVVDGDYAFVAWYLEGLKVLDISDPSAPELVGAYDTWDAEGPDPLDKCIINGAFGVRPQDDRVLLGGESGLWVFDFDR